MHKLKTSNWKCKDSYLSVCCISKHAEWTNQTFTKSQTICGDRNAATKMKTTETHGLKRFFHCINAKIEFAKSTKATDDLLFRRKYSSAPNWPTKHVRGGQERATLQQTSPETFDNYRLAYGNRSTFELLRALGFFFLCRFSFATDNAVKIMEFCYKVMGQRLSEFVIRKAVYDQFVAGETTQELKDVALQLSQRGVATILCVPMETDDRTSDKHATKEHFFDTNVEKVVASIQLSTELGNLYPMAQFRISALMAGDLTKVVSRYCANTTHNEEVMSALTEAMLGSQVNFSQLSGWAEFPLDRNDEFTRGLQRLGKIVRALDNRDAILLVDAEYTSINPALRMLALCLMSVCNKDSTKIFYTYQAYLKATRKNLEQDFMFAASKGFGFGVKLVRGAYLIAERQAARELGYDDPVNESFDLTSASYQSCLDVLLEQAAAGRSVRFMIASHNEDTMRYAIRRIDELGIPKDGPLVFFGQLYGMADHVSFTLGNHGYRIYKSVPYGSVLETIPYLSRRAQENKAVLLNARRERKLVAKALMDRLMFRV